MAYFNRIKTVLILGILSVLTLGHFLPGRLKGRSRIIPRLPLLIFSFYYFLYWVCGSAYILSDKKYFMLNTAVDAVPYSLLVVMLSYIAFVAAFYVFKPVKFAEPVSTDLPLSYGAAVITSYALLWVLRLYLMKLGLYYKYAAVYNLMNVGLPPMVNVFYQVMQFLPFLFIMVSIVYFRRLPWLVPVLETINFVLFGWKSAIFFAIVFGVLMLFIYGRLGLRDILLKKRTVVAALLVMPLFYVSFYITPYVYSRNLLLSKDYLQEIIRDIPDFVDYVATSHVSEAKDPEYMHTRLAAINPLSAIVYRIKFEHRGLIEGGTLVEAVDAILPRVLYPDKPERFGDDPEEQDALRHYDLPDADTVGTIVMSGYANFGLPGSLAGMFLFGAFVALAWSMVLKMAASRKSFVQFNGFLLMVFFLTRMLILEQTFVTATLLNVRNILFILAVFNAIRFFYSVLLFEFFGRMNMRSESV